MWRNWKCETQRRKGWRDTWALTSDMSKTAMGNGKLCVVCHSGQRSDPWPISQAPWKAMSQTPASLKPLHGACQFKRYFYSFLVSLLSLGYENHSPKLEDNHTSKDNDNKTAFCYWPKILGQKSAELCLDYKGKWVLEKVKDALAANWDFCLSRRVWVSGTPRHVLVTLKIISWITVLHIPHLDRNGC